MLSLTSLKREPSENVILTLHVLQPLNCGYVRLETGSVKFGRSVLLETTTTGLLQPSVCSSIRIAFATLVHLVRGL